MIRSNFALVEKLPKNVNIHGKPVLKNIEAR